MEQSTDMQQSGNCVSNHGRKLKGIVGSGVRPASFLSGGKKHEVTNSLFKTGFN